jgi:general stress protein 26
MNSINAEQPEHNRENLDGHAAVVKIRELVKQSPTCFFCTGITSGKHIPTRPMAVQNIDDDGILWFLAASDSSLCEDLAHDPAAQLLFQGSAHSDFLTLYARGEVSVDNAKIDALWEPIMKTWFTEGKADPRIRVVKVTPVQGYYWDTKHNRAIAFAKMVAGAIVGKTLDDSIEGVLRP